MLNNIYCTNDTEEILEQMSGGWRIHDSFLHADTMGVGVHCPLIISIDGDNI